MKRNTKHLFIGLTFAVSCVGPGVGSCVGAGGALEARTLRIATLDAARLGSTNIATGSLLDSLRESLAQNIKGLGYEAFQFVAVRDLLQVDLREAADVVVMHNAHKPFHGTPPLLLSAAEQTALFEFVAAGGSAVIATQDGGDGANALVAPFGMSVTGALQGVQTDTIPKGTSHAVVNGPFGTARYLKTSAAAWFSELGPYATSLVRSSVNQQPLLAAIEADAVRPGSGRVVLLSDANPFGDANDAFGCGSTSRFLFFPEHEELFLNIMAWISPNASSGEAAALRTDAFVRGDATADGAVDLSDVAATLDWLFLGQDVPACLAASDANRDASVTITDPLFLLGFLFLQGPSPASPFPGCGRSARSDDLRLGCEAARQSGGGACSTPTESSARPGETHQ